MKIRPYERITTNYADLKDYHTAGDRVAAAILALAIEIAQQGGK